MFVNVLLVFSVVIHVNDSMYACVGNSVTVTVAVSLATSADASMDACAKVGHLLMCLNPEISSGNFVGLKKRQRLVSGGNVNYSEKSSAGF